MWEADSEGQRIELWSNSAGGKLLQDPCLTCCRSWKVAQDPQEGQKEEGALCVGYGNTVGVLILAYATLFLIGVAQVIY